MTIRKLIGTAILSSPFVALTAWLWAQNGFLQALLAWGIVLGVLAMLILGIYLVTEDRHG